jgi:hypothetical protein
VEAEDGLSRYVQVFSQGIERHRDGQEIREKSMCWKVYINSIGILRANGIKSLAACTEYIYIVEFRQKMDKDSSRAVAILLMLYISKRATR